MGSFKKYFAAIGTVVLVFVSGGYLTFFWLALANTPEMNPAWTITKHLLPGVSAYDACRTSPDLFAGDRLNLSACGGYQEILYHEPLRPASIKFRFYVNDKAYLLFIRYSESGNFDAFRFSGWEDMRSAWITGFRTGMFKNVTTGNPAIFYPFQWHDVEIHFSNGVMQIYVDEKPIGEFGSRIGLSQFGFRGGFADARVDDIVIEAENGEIIHHDFHNDGNCNSTYAMITAGLAAFFILLILVIRSRRNSEVAFNMAFAVASIVLLLSVLSYHYAMRDLDTVLPSRELSVAEIVATDAQLKAAAEHFTEKYTTEPSDDVVRVLILGGTQTAGEGSMRENGGYVYFTDRYLSQVMPEIKAYVMNGACSGANAGQLLELYKGTYRAYAPDIIVLNTGAQDQATPRYKSTLEEFIKLAQQENVRLILATEAVAPEDPRGQPATHEIIRAVGKEFDVPVVDVCKQVWKKEKYGFLFWDYVRPTDYGHDMISQALLPAIQNKMKEVAAERETKE